VRGDVVFIHGMFMNPKCWKGWIRHFGDHGYTCHAPAWPLHEGEPADLRARPDPELGRLTLGRVVEALGAVVDRLPAAPVLIGHSMGGLVVQKLLNEGKGRAGVCIDSAPPKGVFSLSWSFLRSNLPTVNPLAGDSPCHMTLERFHYTFCNTMTPEETRAAFEELVVPESRNVARSSTGADGRIDFARPHAPLLFVAGEQDHIIPAALNRRNHGAYTDAGSRRTLRVFPGRGHFICGQRGWEEVADYVEGWLRENAPA
jgi:pimeloyl-ACP methyl ester carboxylesterase